MLLDVEVLRVIWWLLLGVLLMGFAVTDGFDLGAAALLPLVTRNDQEKRALVSTFEPVWEGNQVWIILGAGAIFAAWPYVYAVAFSSAYLPVLLLLLTMGISRPVAIKYRNKLMNTSWRFIWDTVIFLSGFLTAIILGILVGNVIQGIPYSFDETLRVTYSGSFLNFFNPFALWCGVTSLFMLLMHGGLYLAMNLENPIRARAIFWAKIATLLLLFCFAIGGIWVANFVMGYQVVDSVDHFGYSNPLHKEVVPVLGAWIQNYYVYPIAILVPLLGFGGGLGALYTAKWKKSRFAFLCSCVCIMGVIGTVGVSMFPFILPSSEQLSSSLLVWDASSSQLTLLLMLGATVFFLPIILLYTAWVYRVLQR